VWDGMHGACWQPQGPSYPPPVLMLQAPDCKHGTSSKIKIGLCAMDKKVGSRCCCSHAHVQEMAGVVSLTTCRQPTGADTIVARHGWPAALTVARLGPRLEAVTQHNSTHWDCRILHAAPFPA